MRRSAAAAAAAVFTAAVASPRVRKWLKIHWELAKRARKSWRDAQAAAPVGLRRKVSRMRELLFLLNIERTRLLEVAEAERRFPEDPDAVYKLHPLQHVRTQRQLAAARSTAKKRKEPRPPSSSSSPPIATELVLVGGGHSHVHVLRMLGMEPIEGVRVTLVAKDVETPYSGMLPGHVAGQYSFRECHIDLQQMARFAGVRLIKAEVTHIDTRNRTLSLRGRPDLAYDVLSINVGITPAFPGAVAESSSVVTPVKPIASFSRTWDALLQKLERWEEDRVYDIVVVGGGAGGVELALAMRARVERKLEELGKKNVVARFSLLTRGPRVLGSHSDGVKTCMERALKARNIHVVARCEALAAVGSSLKCLLGNKTEKSLPFDECIWCTQASAPAFLKESGLECDPEGFAVVDEYQRCRTAEDEEDRASSRVYAVGDCATVAGHPRPKAGVFAVMAGMALYANLVADLTTGAPRVSHVPQKSFLGLLGTGDGSCVASRGELAFQADWLWELKDWIDRKWMWQYTRGLPEKMVKDEVVPPGAFAQAEGGLELWQRANMRCGGCGAKVGASVLSRTLRALPKAPTFKNAVVDVLVGVDGADDAAVVEYAVDAAEVVVPLAHTIDFFRAMVDDPYLLGQIAANHALSDVDAMNARPASALALVVLPYAAERVVEADLTQVMRGVRVVLDDAGCALVGGHTCEGAELSVGLAVNGVFRRGPPITKGDKMQPGDVLVLTKPVGTGTVFAADMRAEASYPIVEAAVSSMLLPNRKAVDILAPDCTACTDVTGFGLVGHLSEMCRAAGGADVDLELGAVPFLPGALDLSARGFRSSLHPDNARASRAISNHDEISHHPGYSLLFDPQTAGGLLATVPARRASRVLDNLRDAGFDAAAKIGTIKSTADNLAFPAKITVLL
ncbi:hypothetical protein CTAYLR_007528 [Chrysophaeum taylorii]|uniref:Selenide, water dikinase n=1 Tax=Chrysophaeum taylorii TaxID=2483200 RepID=A0AAD7U8B9_9STRA|nr:hypothetical protein CTAYLR_007528 [Chrysophaeum taylorii]